MPTGTSFLSMSLPSLGVTFDNNAGKVRLVAVSAEEAMSQPFVARLTMLSLEPDIKTTDMLLKPATLKISREDYDERYLSGFFRSFTRGDVRHGGEWSYTAELVPRSWFMTQTVDCRVFHDMTPLDLVVKLLKENDVTPEVLATAKDKRKFIVQYNESDFSFCQRLLEEDGHYYFFKHSKTESKLCIADKNTSFFDITNGKMEMNIGAGGFSSWNVVKHSASGSVQLLGYNALQAAAVVGDSVKTKHAGAPFKEKRDVVLFPARSRVKGFADARARIIQEAAEATTNTVQGACQNFHFAPGGRFSLLAGPQGTRSEGDYVVSSVSYYCSDDTQGSGSGRESYTNQFTAFPADCDWRQPLVTPRPHMGGVYNAIVVGKSGDEIDVTDDGRIKVRFFWDHVPDATGDNTIEIRVMQPWSGNGWGWQHFPRVGTEVLVAFVNGDPDDPIVVGCLYNGAQKHPFTLTAQKTKSGIKTRSSKGGGTADYNEFSLDDKKGEEMVLLHAQKDHSVTVENDETVYVMHDQKITVDNDRTRLVKHDETVTIKNNQTLTVTNNRATEITNGTETLTVKTGDMTTKVSTGNWAMGVAMGNMSTKVDMGNYDMAVSMGNISVKAALGKISVEAMQSIELKVGQSSIKLDPMGVTISGMMIKIDGQIQTDVHGLMTNIKGDAMTQVKGAIVMIGP